MCFGGRSMPKTEVKYEKPDFGPLPSLQSKENIKRTGPQYGQVRKGSMTRSLLNPMGMGNG
jgi:hypothetical protein